MGIQDWTVWIVVIIFAVLSILLLMGKGSFLIAGYNTASKEEKENYNEKRLCRTVGGGMLLLTVILIITTIYDNNLPGYLTWIMPWGFFGVILVMLVLANTICKNK